MISAFLSILPHADVEQLSEDCEESAEAFDLGGGLAGGGIDAGDGEFFHAKALFRGLDGEVVVELIAVETGAKDVDLRVDQQLAAVGAEAVGGVGIAEPGCQ